MAWYQIAETSAKKASFLMLDISYHPALLKLKKKTGHLEKFASYINQKNNIVTEFMSDDDKNWKSTFGLQFFKNKKNFNNYKAEVKAVILATNNFKQKFSSKNLAQFSTQKLSQIFKQALVIYQSALSLYLLSQPEYFSGLEEYLKQQLAKVVPLKNVDNVLGVLTMAIKESCLEQERLAWLKNVMLPALKENKNFAKAKNDLVIIKQIKQHIKKYQYYSASIEFGLWDETHYQFVFKKDWVKGKIQLKRELKNIESKANKILTARKKIIKQYKLNSQLCALADTISQLGIIRIDLRILGWQFFNYFFPELFASISRQAGVDLKFINNLGGKEFIKFLDNKRNLVKKASAIKSSTLIMISPKTGYKVFYNKLAEKKFVREFKHHKSKTKNLKGTVAYQQGIITGKVFVFNWGAKNFKQQIYNFPKNAILVTGQTRPLLIPALRNAKAIITDEGGILCHAAIISRELKKPCIIGTKQATKILHAGDLVEMNTVTGYIKILKKSRS